MRVFNMLAVLAMVPAAAHAAPKIDPAPVVAAERAFAADGLAMGVRDSFLKHSAPEAVVFRPDPVSVHESFPKTPPDQGGPPLTWWPLWAGIAKSGDLGFTTGPFAVNGRRGGYYFTVWRKQADGVWRWVYDGGPPSDASSAGEAGSPVAYLPVAVRGQGANAKAEITAREAALHAGAKTDLATAIGAAAASDGMLAGGRVKPETTAAGRAQELATRPRAVLYETRAVDASAAGDLVWTWGTAAWTTDGQARLGHYVRVWQARPEGWRIVYDSLLPKPPPPPPVGG